MNDRFKFRAWYNNTEMVYGIENMQNFCDWVKETDQDPVMQCTGLKDKNGKLIYEGDIVKIIQTNPAQKRIGVVQWRCGYFSISYTKIGEYGECGIGITKDTTDFVVIEVIGNIYENKELLQ